MISQYELDHFDDPGDELMDLSVLGLHSIITQRVTPTVELIQPAMNPEAINLIQSEQGEA